MKTMADVLSAHTRRGGIRSLAIHCECGWSQSILTMPSSKKAFAAHQSDALTAAGFGPVEAERETVTEWAAAFPKTGNVHNYHRTREEAQAFVDGMREVGADMVVMTRGVLPQDASDWKPADGSGARDLLGIAPDFTGGLSVDEYMDEQRGRGEG